MLDERPTAAELVKAVADFLEKKVVAELTGHTAFHTKVSVNALRIVQRELEDGGAIDRAERARLASLLGADGELKSLNATLCARIADGSLPVGDAALRDHLWQSVLARIAVDSPKYPSLAETASRPSTGQ